MIARMWEARANPGRTSDLVDWVFDTAMPVLSAAPRYLDAQIYRSQDRVVVIGHWSAEPIDLPPAPAELVARPPHSWDFTPVVRD